MRPWLVVLPLLLVTPSAWAQAPDFERARRHFDAGSQALQQGDYPRAELEFRAAYAVTKDPLLLFNIGQAQQRRGHLEAAVKSFRAYLAGVPNAEDRADVESTIRAIEQELATARPGGGSAALVAPAEKPKPRTPRDEGDSHARRQSAWIVGSIGVAMLAVGGAMSGLSWKKAADANKLIDQRDVLGLPIPFANVETEYNARKRDAATFGGVAIGMYVAGAVCLGVATYLLVSSRGKPRTEKREARLRLVPVLDPRNAGLVAGMEF